MYIFHKLGSGKEIIKLRLNKKLGNAIIFIFISKDARYIYI